MKFRPEAEIWPVMTDEQLKVLAADIDANGQQYKISLYQNAILDGRNRWLAITKFTEKEKEPEFETVRPSSPIAFVISRNEKRRHLDESQRGWVGAAALPFFEAEAKKRMAEGGKVGGKKAGRGRKGASPIGDKPIKHLAADDAAKAFGTSPRNIQRGKTVHEKGSKKLNDAVARGTLKLGKAEHVIKLYPDKERQDKQVIIIAKSKMATRVKGLTGEFEWYTPRPYLDAAIEVMGGIDLDPASSKQAQAHVKAAQYFTVETDGLKQSWNGRVFLNPPYAMPFIKEFTTKMIAAWRASEMNEGILLTNNATDTEWFHAALSNCNAVCFTKGRIKFLEASDGDLIEKDSPTHGQAFFYFGNNIWKFAKTFARFGAILVDYMRQQCPA
jgi:phage N-6-adenine-methyltransferase